MGIFDRNDRLDLFIHVDGSVMAIFNTINERVEQIMADTQATLAKLQAANESLNGIRADIAALKALIAAGGTPDEVAAAVDALAANLAQTDSEQ